jgi:hypothetical protein
MSVGELTMWRDLPLKENVGRSAEQGPEATLQNVFSLQGTSTMAELTDMTSPSETVSLVAGILVQVSAQQYSLRNWVVKRQVGEGGLKDDPVDQRERVISMQETEVGNSLSVSFLDKGRCKE